MTKVCLSFVLFIALIWIFPVTISRAHCDTLDGPVVSTARDALQRGDVTPVLKWIPEDDENEIRELFAQTMSVRALSPQAQALADQHFFETLVRVHRAGEGVPYTGLKPAGAVEPGIALADHALAEGSADAVVRGIGKGVDEGIRKRFAAVKAVKAHADDSVAAGRAYVAAYVDYIHYVEALNELASGSAEPHGHGHQHAAEAPQAHEGH